MYIIDLDNSPKAAEFARLKSCYDKNPGDFESAVQAAKCKVQLWKSLGLKCSENEEYEIKGNILIISEYEKI